MSVFFRRRGEPPATPIAVTITGTGDSRKCYAIINGTTQYTAGTHEVYAGDTITFGVVGRAFPNYGSVIINKTEVLIVTEFTAKTYDWTVPNGISTVEIAMVYSKKGIGQITVTTA